QHVMAARVLGACELDRWVGAARPPAVGREVQDAERSGAHWICRRSGFAGRPTQARLAFGCGSHHGSTVGESTRTLIGFARRSGFAGLRRSTVGESTRTLIGFARRSGFAGLRRSTVGESTRTVIARSPAAPGRRRARAWPAGRAGTDARSGRHGRSTGRTARGGSAPLR